ncbi:MAG: hypothetical protein M3P06_07165 [Acidobacteriota bacterium]|nr:hypothetical protein [Acidobacteriota bacterium]
MAAGFALWAMVLFLPATAVRAADALFPRPLHITRELSDPVSQKTTRIDEYCHGNRIVSVSGMRTAIADYAKGELTEIDFAAGTYSVTKFESIARVHEKNAPRVDRAAASTARNEWRVQSLGGSVIASRPAETTEVESDADGSRRVIRISSDRQLTMSRAAVEAVMGIGYPHRTDSSADVVLSALRVRAPRIANNAAGADTADVYGLPLEHVVRAGVGGEMVETRNVVVRLGDELPPLDVLSIPPGAKLVESKAVAAQRLLEELDRPPSRSNGND